MIDQTAIKENWKLIEKRSYGSIISIRKAVKQSMFNAVVSVLFNCLINRKLIIVVALTAEGGRPQIKQKLQIAISSSIVFKHGHFNKINGLSR